MNNYLKLWLTQLSNKLHFIVIFIILLALTYYNIYNIILLIIYLIYLYKVRLLDYLFISIFIIFSFYISVNFIIYNKTNALINTKATIIEKEDNRYLVSSINGKYYFYIKDNYEVGDIIHIIGKLEHYKTPSYDGDYNMKLSLFSKYIKGYIKPSKIEKVGHRFTLYVIRDKILNIYKDKIKEESFRYFSALTLAKNDLDKDKFIKLNLAHIIAISGFHIVLIYTFIKRMLFRFTHDLYKSDIIALSIIIIYNILTCFTVSVMKATIYLLIKRENDKYKILTTLDVLSLTFLFLMLTPRIIYNIGFILGFLASFILIYMHEFIQTKNNILKNFYQGLIMLLVMLPFISKMNNELSLLALFSFIFFNLFSYFLIPYCFILYIIPSLSIIVEPSIILINNILGFTSNLFIIKFPAMKDIYIYFYYSLLFIFLINNKLIVKSILSLLILFIVYIPLVITYDKVEFIDVGQGDATLIRSSDTNVLIDAHNCYNYLVKHGIYKIKYIFITHDDLDHLSDLEKILLNIKVDVVYTNKYSSVVLEICERTNSNISFLEFGDKLRIGNNLITVLSPKYDHKEDNLNSLVLKYNTKHFTYLFTGDMTSVNEKELLHTNIGEIDILKVAHHGSNTSSSPEFLHKIKPKYSIVSVGKNRFGLPDKYVIDYLNSISKVYITLNNGNIRVVEDKIYAYK